ncbi:hypothetical protein [Algihabitans sp.]|uniref:hypothetical protein n=1 Tax=Algihabitans sp. TaxID=2821514 RepID=UPI003BAA1173
MIGEREFEIGSDAARRLVARTGRSRTSLERPEPILLASWLEGRLSEAESARVEAWIADAPEAAEEVALLRAATEAAETEAAETGRLAAPAAFVSRAQAIVRTPARVESDDGSWIARFLGQPIVRWSAMAALALVVGVGGFGIGTEGLAPSLASFDSVQVTVADFGAQPAPFL